jgi:hypothetical protein
MPEGQQSRRERNRSSETLGWNAMPTSWNARGTDVIAYNHDCTKIISVQVKLLSKRNPVPLGRSLDRIMGD